VKSMSHINEWANQSYYTIKCEKHVSYHRVSQSIILHNQMWKACLISPSKPINQSYYTIECEKHVSYHQVSQSINHITQSNVKSMSHITE
jgi:hypothetical protein